MPNKPTRTRKPSATRNSRQKFTARLKDCARCGSTHRALRFKAFEQPISLGGTQWHFWTMCPKTGDPVILKQAGT